MRLSILPILLLTILAALAAIPAHASHIVLLCSYQTRQGPDALHFIVDYDKQIVVDGDNSRQFDDVSITGSTIRFFWHMKNGIGFGYDIDRLGGNFRWYTIPDGGTVKSGSCEAVQQPKF